METLLVDLLLILLLVMTAGYLLGAPLRTLWRFRRPAHFAVQPIKTQDALPSVVRKHVAELEGALAGEGFEAAGMFLLPQAMPNSRTLQVLLVNRSKRDTAQSITIFGPQNDQWSVWMQIIAYATRFRSGRVISTDNAVTTRWLPASENVVLIHFPWIGDPLELYRVHAAIVARKGDGGEKELRLDTQHRGDGAAFLEASMREELEAARGTGYLRLSPDGAHYRMTVKGAYLTSWAAMPPFYRWLQRRRHRQAQALLAELGIDV